MKTKQILLVFILLSCKLLTAQSWQWAKSGGNNNKPAFIRLKEPKQKAEDNKENTTDKNQLVIYPNPAKTQVTIKAKEVKQIQVTDMQGRSVINKNYDGTASSIQLQTGTLKAGMYIIIVTDAKNQKQTAKLVIQ